MSEECLRTSPPRGLYDRGLTGPRACTATPRMKRGAGESPSKGRHEEIALVPGPRVVDGVRDGVVAAGAVQSWFGNGSTTPCACDAAGRRELAWSGPLAEADCDLNELHDSPHVFHAADEAHGKTRPPPPRRWRMVHCAGEGCPGWCPSSTQCWHTWRRLCDAVPPRGLGHVDKDGALVPADVQLVTVRALGTRRRQAPWARGRAPSGLACAAPWSWESMVGNSSSALSQRMV